MKKTLYEDTARGELRKESNRLNHIAATQATTMQRGVQRPGKLKPKKQPKKGPKSKKTRALNLDAVGNLTAAHLPSGWSHVGRWARLVENPFCGDKGIKCPFNFNPAPSLMSTTATTVNYESSLAVAASNTRQLVLWPGHYIMDNIVVASGAAASGASYPAQMDAVAYHQSTLLVGATDYNVGPGPATTANATTAVACAAVISADTPVATNGVVVNSTVGASVQLWDNPYPITAALGGGSHMRWKMISMGIKIRNITPAATRGGAIVSVQPAFQVTVADYASQAKFSQHPSFHNWGDGTEEITISWIPRPTDLSYWHLNNSLSSPGVNSSNTTITGPGILIWFNAPAAAQQYEYTHIAHWEIAGTSVQILSQATVGSGVNDQQLKVSLGAHAEGSPTAAGFAGTVESMVKTGKAVVRDVARVGKAVVRTM